MNDMWMSGVNLPFAPADKIHPQPFVSNIVAVYDNCLLIRPNQTIVVAELRWVKAFVLPALTKNPHMQVLPSKFSHRKIISTLIQRNNNMSSANRNLHSFGTAWRRSLNCKKWSMLPKCWGGPCSAHSHRIAAMEWPASVRTLRMSTRVITFYTYPRHVQGWDTVRVPSTSQPHCFGTYCAYVVTRDNVCGQWVAKRSASVHALHMSQTCVNACVQNATQLTALVHVLQMSQTCDNVRVQSAE